MRYNEANKILPEMCDTSVILNLQRRLWDTYIAMQMSGLKELT